MVSLISDQYEKKTKPNRFSDLQVGRALNGTLECGAGTLPGPRRAVHCSAREAPCTAAGDSSEIRPRVFHVMRADGRERGV